MSNIERIVIGIELKNPIAKSKVTLFEKFFFLCFSLTVGSVELEVGVVP